MSSCASAQILISSAGLRGLSFWACSGEVGLLLTADIYIAKNKHLPSGRPTRLDDKYMHDRAR